MIHKIQTCETPAHSCKHCITQIQIMSNISKIRMGEKSFLRPVLTGTKAAVIKISTFLSVLSRKASRALSWMPYVSRSPILSAKNKNLIEHAHLLKISSPWTSRLDVEHSAFRAAFLLTSAIKSDYLKSSSNLPVSSNPRSSAWSSYPHKCLFQLQFLKHSKQPIDQWVRVHTCTHSDVNINRSSWFDPWRCLYLIGWLDIAWMSMCIIIYNIGGGGE